MTFVVTGLGWMTAVAWGTGKTAAAFQPVSGSFSDAATRFRPAPPYPRFNRMDAVSKAAFAAVVLAAKDAGMDLSGRKKSVGIIAATRFGCLETDGAYFQGLSSREGTGARPHQFAYTLPSACIGDVAIHLGFTGPGFVVQEKNALSLNSLRFSLEILHRKEAVSMVVGAYDTGLLAPFAFEKKTPAYALFWVIESAAARKKGYGKIEVRKNDHVYFRQKRVYDLFGILDRIRAAPKGSTPSLLPPLSFTREPMK
ncbi:MAG: hypothetical protein JRI83_05135 [Deltaproteobacteria bacterium]|nr:hypothetical protein [Deltaproteobacteria bacterium]